LIFLGGRPGLLIAVYIKLKFYIISVDTPIANNQECAILSIERINKPANPLTIKSSNNVNVQSGPITILG